MNNSVNEQENTRLLKEQEMTLKAQAKQQPAIVSS